MASQIVRHPEAFSLDSRTRQKQPRKHSADHLKWLRGLPCLVTGARPVEAAHIRKADARYFKRAVGAGEKPDDKWCVPLSADQHRKQHATNEEDFWHETGIDPVFVAAMLWAHSGNDEIAEQIISQARERAKP